MKKADCLFRLTRGLLGAAALAGLECRSQQAGSLSVQVAGKQLQVDYLLPGANVTWNTTFTVSGLDPIITTPFPGFVGFVSRLNPASDTGIRYKQLVVKDSSLVDGVATLNYTHSFTYQRPGQWEEKWIFPNSPGYDSTAIIPSVAGIYDQMEGAAAVSETEVIGYVYYRSTDYDGRVTQYITDRSLSDPAAPATSGGEPYSFLYSSNEIPSAQSDRSTSVTTIYNLTVPPGITGKIHWLEVFTPAADPGNKQYTAREWLINGLTSPDFALTAPAAGSSVVVPYEAQLAVDANRDGQIKLAGEEASDADSAEAIHRFWINDDNDSGDIDTADIPGSSTPDGEQVKVQGVRDLVDFFPVFLDLKQLLAVLPPGAEIKYKLKQADEGLRFVYTDLSRAEAFKYLYDYPVANALKDAEAHRMTFSGYELDAAWLGLVKDAEKGVILIEGRNATANPMVLSVEKTDGTKIVEVTLGLGIVPVETMFRHMNLRDRSVTGLVGGKGDDAAPESMGDPAGFPDDPNSNGRWLIFVHGFNVTGQESRGWNAEMFKRTYWSGNKSRFVGVSWFGNPDDALGPLPADYHLAMRNAMATAPVLAQEINALPGSAATKTMFAHSLGCGVISSAIADYSMTIGRVCFVDAALARESFDGRSPGSFTQENDGMTPAVWKPYSPRLYAANWFARFDPTTDARGKLTWSSRFSSASSVVYNFYSSTEDVLAEYTGELPSTLGGIAWDAGTHGSFGWVYQEKGKGNRQNYGLGGPQLTHLGSYYGGWGMNLKDPVLSGDTPYWKWINSDSYIGRMIKAPLEVGDRSDSVLRRHPMFEPGWGVVRNQEQQENPVSNVSPVDGASSWIYDLYLGTAGNTLARDPVNSAQLLAEAVPSLTWCLGSHKSENAIASNRNFNLPSFVDRDNWPRGKFINVTPEWRHSDMREVAYIYQYRVFDQIISISKP